MINKKQEWEENKKQGFARAKIDNFLDEKTCLKLYEECLSAPRGGWTIFTRAGSRMEEFNDLIHCPTAHQVTYDLMHSGEMLYDLEQMTGITGLLPDPHLVGAGFSIMRDGAELGPHYDFNWNDRLRLHRKLTSILYITPDWEEKWGGAIELWDQNMKKNFIKLYPHLNNALIFRTDTESNHGFPDPISCPKNIGRKSLAVYYYVKDESLFKRTKYYYARWKRRPGIDEPKFGDNRNFLEKFKNNFLFRFNK